MAAAPLFPGESSCAVQGSTAFACWEATCRRHCLPPQPSDGPGLTRQTSRRPSPAQHAPETGCGQVRACRHWGRPVSVLTVTQQRLGCRVAACVGGCPGPCASGHPPACPAALGAAASPTPPTPHPPPPTPPPPTWACPKRSLQSRTGTPARRRTQGTPSLQRGRRCWGVAGRPCREGGWGRVGWVGEAAAWAGQGRGFVRSVWPVVLLLVPVRPLELSTRPAPSSGFPSSPPHPPSPPPPPPHTHPPTHPHTHTLACI